MNQFHRPYYGVAYFTIIALVFITLGIEYFQYQRHQNLILIDLKNRLDEHTININLRARAVQGYVNGLKIAAQNSLFYIREFKHMSFLFPLIKEEPNKSEFYLDIKDPRISRDAIGNLSGRGSIKDLSKEGHEEMNMALFLNTFFVVALKNIRGAVWGYYCSKNQFQTLYPWVPISPSALTEELQNNLSLQKAKTEKPPYTHNFWTPAYRDEIAEGQPYPHGLVVTNSSPVYDGERLLGVVSIDFSLTELNRVMDQFQSSSGSLFLINKDFQVLATKGVDPRLLSTDHVPQLQDLLAPEMIQKINQALKDQSGWFSLEGPSVVYVKNLTETPWFVVYVDSKSKLFLDAFFEALQDIFIISLLLIIVVGVGYALVMRNFITPAQKLVNHLVKENKGIKSTPKDIPQKWQPWFDIITLIFEDNRSLVQGLELRVQERTQQWEQKNQELEQTLTALKKAKNQIIVQEKLASLGSLTAGIAHEIKNPLNFIINFTDLSLEDLQELKGKISNDLFDRIEKNMTKSREHAERADTIVKTMLAHARGSKGEVSTFDLNALLNQALELALFAFQEQKNKINIKIIKEFDKNITTIQGFEQELMQVFLNIINNACFSMQEKWLKLGDQYQPELIVRTKDVGLTITITVQDNGKGMSPTVLSKIFTPFFTTKGAGKGTGLGLSLSHDIITRQHHGKVYAESHVDEYARFIIELPKVV